MIREGCGGVGGGLIIRLAGHRGYAPMYYYAHPAGWVVLLLIGRSMQETN